MQSDRLELARLRNERLPDLDPLVNPEKPRFYDPTEVLKMGLRCLDSVSQIERYSIMEQIIESAIDVSDIKTAQKYLNELNSAFPSSNRVMRLKGLIFESTDPEKSAKIYKQAIKRDITNVSCLKRLIMLSDRQDAIKLLVIHLDNYQQDIDAWAALARLYIEENMFAQASFCYEETLLLRPTSHVHMLRYADILSSLKKYSTGLKYYCAVVDILPFSLHAWYGIHSLVSTMIKEKIGDKINNQTLLSVSKDQIKNIYANSDNMPSKVVKMWLK